jgi:hypothetical protein
MKKADFLNAVKHEVETLKELATENELKRLNFRKFNHDHHDACIYGQMTGSCGSKRAKVLMDKACVIVTKDACVISFENRTFKEVKKHINGANTGQGWNDDGGSMLHFVSRNYSHLSALEAYICMKNAKTENIIKYLKGETDTLKL